MNVRKKYQPMTWMTDTRNIACIAIEKADEELLKEIKEKMAETGIENASINTIRFEQHDIGLVFIEDGYTLVSDYWTNAPDDIKDIEQTIIEYLNTRLAQYSWDGYWYFRLFSNEDINDGAGLSNYFISDVPGTKDFCCVYKNTKDSIPISVFYFKVLPFALYDELENQMAEEETQQNQST